MRVLVATDGTECGLAAARAVTGLKLGAMDEIAVVSVVDMSPPFDFDGGTPSVSADELEAAFLTQAERSIESARSIIDSNFAPGEVTVRNEILFGSPAKRIVEAAEEWQIDLIIVGSHGYGKLQRLLLGSVSDAIVHHSHCSVMVVRAVSEEHASLSD